MCTAHGSSHARGVSASVHAGIHTLPGVGLETPRVWTWRPPGCGPGDPLGVDLETPLGVDLETPLGVDLETPLGVGLETPQVWAWRPARHAGIPPPVDRRTCVKT